MAVEPVLAAAAGTGIESFAGNLLETVAFVLVRIGTPELEAALVGDMFGLAVQGVVMLEVAYQMDSSFEEEVVDFVQMKC